MTGGSDKPFISAVASDFLTKFCRVVDEDGSDLCIYRVGSSLYRVDQRGHDVDLLLVRPNSQGQIHHSALLNLRDRMLAGQALAGAFDATDSETKLSLATAARGCTTRDETDLVVQCRIGPVPQPQTDRPTIYVHVCGPLTCVDNQTFFDLLPFHGLAFAALNRCLRGRSLTEVVTPPRPSRQDLNRWNQTIERRIMSANSVEALMKVLRKLFLNCLLFKGVTNPYESTERMLGAIMNDANFPGKDPAAALKYVEVNFPSIQYQARLDTY